MLGPVDHCCLQAHSQTEMGPRMEMWAHGHLSIPELTQSYYTKGMNFYDACDDTFAHSGAQLTSKEKRDYNKIEVTCYLCAVVHN